MENDDRTELTALRDRLRSLCDWAGTRLDDENCDRQYIAEHMTADLDALLAHRKPPARPC